MPEPEAPLIVYSDYVCPFCYLGKASLERYLERADPAPEVEWRPFDLRSRKRTEDNEIDHTVADGKDEAYYEQAKRNVERLAKEYDVEMTLDIARDVDAWNAHKVALAIEEAGDGERLAAYHDAVFEALWKHGHDIGDVEVLVEVAGEVGIEAATVREAVESEQLEGKLEERFQQAHREGITGVPTFRYGELQLPGAMPPENIEKLVENG